MLLTVRQRRSNDDDVCPLSFVQFWRYSRVARFNSQRTGDVGRSGCKIEGFRIFADSRWMNQFTSPTSDHLEIPGEQVLFFFTSEFRHITCGEFIIMAEHCIMDMPWIYYVRKMRSRDRRGKSHTDKAWICMYSLRKHMVRSHVTRVARIYQELPPQTKITPASR